MVKILYDDWSIRLGENSSNHTLKHLAVMLHSNSFVPPNATIHSDGFVFVIASTPP